MQVKQIRPKHYIVHRGSAELGKFWFANGTIYANTSHDCIGHDIGLMDTKNAAQWVERKYFESK